MKNSDRISSSRLDYITKLIYDIKILKDLLETHIRDNECIKM